MGRKKKNQHYFLFNSGGLCGDSGDLDAIEKMITEMADGDADKLEGLLLITGVAEGVIVDLTPRISFGEGSPRMRKPKTAPAPKPPKPTKPPKTGNGTVVEPQFFDKPEEK